MENYTIILYSCTIFATHLLISMDCEDLQKKSILPSHQQNFLRRQQLLPMPIMPK